MRKMAQCMMGYYLIMLLLCIGATMSAGDKEEAERIDKQIKKVTAAAARLGLNVFHRVGNTLRYKGNLAVSPHSMYTMGAMMYESTTVTDAKTQLATALNVKNVTNLKESMGYLLKRLMYPGRPYRLYMADRIFIHNSVEVPADVKETIETNYRASIHSLHFNDSRPDIAAFYINGWMEGKTDNRIQELYSVGKSARVLFAHGIYFHGIWKYVFKRPDTRNDTFTDLNGKEIKIPFMFANKKYGLFKDDKKQLAVVKVSYHGRSMALYIFLPDSGKTPENVKSHMNSVSSLNALMNKVEEDDICLFLPKFSISKKVRNYLTYIKLAGFRSAYDTSSLFGHKCHTAAHMVTFAATEDGTEPPVFGVAERSSKVANPGPKCKEIKISRPFYFIVRDDRTMAWLYFGLISDPSAA